MTEPKPTYEFLGAVLGPEPDTPTELLEKIATLTTHVARYRHALRVIAGLSEPAATQRDAMQIIAMHALTAYNDHKPCSPKPTPVGPHPLTRSPVHSKGGPHVTRRFTFPFT